MSSSPPLRERSSSEDLLGSEPRTSNRNRYKLNRKWLSPYPLIAASVLVLITLIALIFFWRTGGGSVGNVPARLRQKSGCGEYPDDCEVTAPFIFDSLHSMLKQWPSTYAPNGHSVIPVVVPRDTPLYHTKQFPGEAKIPTWTSFDPEMGLGIYASTGVTFAHTFLTTKALNLLYFDGQAATLTAMGTLDSQTALLRGHIEANPSNIFTYNETRRGEELCEFCKTLGLDGVVRMDAGFEALICDRTAVSLKEIIRTNVTVPGRGASRENDPSLPYDPNRLPPNGVASMYGPQTGWEWVRSGTWHYGGYGRGGENQRESRVHLDQCGFVTFYDPSLRSLSGQHTGGKVGRGSFEMGVGPRRGHRLLKIDSDDANTARSYVGEVVSDFLARQKSQSKKSQCSGIDWQAVTEVISTQHKSRLKEIMGWLSHRNSESHTLEEVLNRVHGLSHAVLHPFVEYPNDHTPSLSEIEKKTIQQCSSLYTAYLPQGTYNGYEALVKDSIDIVLHRLCSWEWRLFKWSERHTTDLLNNPTSQQDYQRSTADSRSKIESEMKEIERGTAELLAWLGWDVWDDCEKSCAWNELCYIPMWPVVYSPGKPQGGPWGGGSYTPEEEVEFWKPKCVSLAEFDRYGGRARDPDHQLPDPPAKV